MSWLSLVLPSIVHRAWISGSNEVLSYRVGRSLCIHRNSYCIALSRSMRWQLKTYITRKCKMSALFSGHYLRNRSTLYIGVLGYIGIVYHKEHSPEVVTLTRGTTCICIYSFIHLFIYTTFNSTKHQTIYFVFLITTKTHSCIYLNTNNCVAFLLYKKFFFPLL